MHVLSHALDEKACITYSYWTACSHLAFHSEVHIFSIKGIRLHGAWEMQPWIVAATIDLQSLFTTKYNNKNVSLFQSCSVWQKKWHLKNFPCFVIAKYVVNQCSCLLLYMRWHRKMCFPACYCICGDIVILCSCILLYMRAHHKCVFLLLNVYTVKYTINNSNSF